MRILFCNIAWMKFYQGTIPKIDVPVGGGAWTGRRKTAHESENFVAHTLITAENENKSYCYGSVFLNTKRTNLHVERLEGCELLENEPSAKDVLVIWCASGHIVGWYKDATVYRQNQNRLLVDESGNQKELVYNIEAEADHCLLLPDEDRLKTCWNVPHVNTKGAKFGFGQANVWYAQEEEAQNYIKKISRQIEKYDGENWACGRRIPACTGDRIVVKRGHKDNDLEFDFVLEVEGSRPPVHDMCEGKCIGEFFLYKGQKYTLIKVEKKGMLKK